MLHTYSIALIQDLQKRLDEGEKYILSHQWGRDSGKTTFLIDRFIKQARISPFCTFLYGVDHQHHRRWMIDRILAEVRKTDLKIVDWDNHRITFWNGSSIYVLEASDIPRYMNGHRYHEVYLEQFDSLYVDDELFDTIMKLCEERANGMIALS